MREKVVDTFNDEVTETRRRTVHVIEDIHASISAWHGGHLLKEMSAFTNTKAAIAEAEQICKGYEITPASSLSIRVCETATRYYKEYLGEGERGWGPKYGKETRRSKMTRIRHVWDNRSGPLVTRGSVADFCHKIIVGFREGQSDPGDLLTQFVTDVELRLHQNDRILFTGLGLRDATLRHIERLPYIGEPPQGAKSERADRLAILFVQGRLGLDVPAGMSPKAVQDSLGGFEIDPYLDWDAFNGQPRNWSVWTSHPAVKTEWTYPGSIDLDPSAPDVPAIPAL